MQMPVACQLGATVHFRLHDEGAWEPDWDQFEQAVAGALRFISRTRTIRPARCCRLRRCGESSSAANEREPGYWQMKYLGAEIDAPRTASFWGMSDRVIVTSGLSKVRDTGRADWLDRCDAGTGGGVLVAATA